MDEFSIAVYYYVMHSPPSGIAASSREKALAVAMTKCGPKTFDGPILNDPDAVWEEDRWDEERIRKAEEILHDQPVGVSSYWKRRYEEKAGAYWHAFYTRNQNHFYKDRHYLHIVFSELSPTEGHVKKKITLLEVGCGAVDFARSAIKLLQSHEVYRSSGRIQGHVCDVARDPLPVTPNSVDIALCMFVLSAVPPQLHVTVLKKIAEGLRVGGRVLLRDYGRYDEAQLRFKPSSKIDSQQYVRQDGTLTYYFSIESIQSLADACHTEDGCHLRVLENEYIERQFANRQQKVARYRVWIHVKLEKVRLSLLYNKQNDAL